MCRYVYIYVCVCYMNVLNDLYIYILTDLSAYLSLGYGWYDRSKWLILSPYIEIYHKENLAGMYCIYPFLGPLLGVFHVKTRGQPHERWPLYRTVRTSKGEMRKRFDIFRHAFLRHAENILRHYYWGNHWNPLASKLKMATARNPYKHL